MPAYKDILKRAEELMESFSDDFWKEMPTFSLVSWEHRRNKNWRAVNALLREVRDDQGYYGDYYYVRRLVGKIWNRQRRAAYKRTGYDKVLKQQKAARIDRKKEEFDRLKKTSLETMRKLVSELVLYEHHLQNDQINEKKAKQIQYLAGRFSWMQKEMVKAGRGTDRIKK